MAGTLIPPVGLFVNKTNGRADSGARLTVYDANSSTKVSLYSDSDLTEALDNPLTSDSFGRIPMFWVADGNYRLRLVTSEGSIACDIASVPAVGASDGGGGGGTTPDSWETGDVIPWFKTGTRSGWVRLNGRTIGSASSGATERANADCESLFTWLWTNLDTSFVVSVSGGVGASAAADWAANKTISLPDMRGRALFGLSGMGNSDSGRISAITIDTGGFDTLGSVGGSETVALTIAQLPAVTPAGTVTLSSATVTTNVQTGVNLSLTGGTSVAVSGPTGSTGTGSSSITAATLAFAGTSFGGGAAHDNMPPFMLCQFLMRL